ncbi:hypothetical protein RchiOBHm_Chr7g0205031 [Rosa chinensis]|uniref:Uncharacterized protein n=1 Tax=Rosa chinensis TaxID=74649 RepID=A0A2P6P8V0_ROSCH|nr:hypothetical protein RchiOBHm_Chr7g0205031 [Rosa chinensis]
MHTSKKNPPPSPSKFIKLKTSIANFSLCSRPKIQNHRTGNLAPSTKISCEIFAQSLVIQHPQLIILKAQKNLTHLAPNKISFHI